MKSKCIIDRCLALWSHVAFDTNLAQYVQQRDFDYVAERARREGIVFLTVTLPTLGKALEKGLRNQHLERVEGFACVKGAIQPQLFNRAFNVLFTRNGELRWNESPSYRAITRDDCGLACLAIRQLTLLFYKTELPYNHDQVASVCEGFIQTEWDLLAHATESYADCMADPVFDRARFAVRSLLSTVDPRCIAPRHGSGASACKTVPWARYNEPRFSERLAKVYPYDEFFVSGLNGLESADWLRQPVEHEELTARVALVPKDSRGPRLISCEPREHMFIQQGLMSALYEQFQKHTNISASLDCTDQSRNRYLAGIGSEYGSHATIDLKDASDRLPAWLVKELVPPNWWTALDACRTRVTILPNGERVGMSKFAPMGSACCFPIEAMVFWALAIATVYRSKQSIYDTYFDTCRGRRKDIPVLEQVSVFGDDIIVPSNHAPDVINTLERFGLLVNREKSYLTGPFRESCGADFYDGYDVSIVRVRHLPHAVGQRNVVSHAMFRTRDYINNVALRYGLWNSTRGAELFTELYHAPCTVALSWSDIHDTRHIGTNLAVLGPESTVPPFYKRRVKAGVSQVFILRERSVDREIDTSDWSHVLRVFLTGSRDRNLDGSDRSHAGMVTPARRLRYQYGWARLNGV